MKIGLHLHVGMEKQTITVRSSILIEKARETFLDHLQNFNFDQGKARETLVDHCQNLILRKKWEG